jgi:hypothetical protein
MTDFDISPWASKPPWSSASPSKFPETGFSLQVRLSIAMKRLFISTCVDNRMKASEKEVKSPISR